MNWREKIIVDFPNDLQKNHKARTALADLDRVLLELAGLGHPLHVEEGYVPPPPSGWPKAVFHLHAGARIVRDQFELEELGPDWYPTMEDARHAAGQRKQYERGGIFDPRRMPTILSQTPQEIRRNQDEAIRQREAHRQFVNDARLAQRAGFAAQTYLVNVTEPEHEPDMGEAIERLLIRQ